MLKLLDNTGRKLIGIVQFVGEVMMLIFAVLATLPRFFSRFRETLNQMYLVGVQSLAVTMIFALFSGMILALQTGLQFQRLNTIDLLSTTVVVAMCKEWGPMMTAIILTARAGSAMAAELSVMKVSEEIEALEVMSINPIRYLVLPRIVATVFMCAVLSVLATYIGIWGGYLVYKYQFSSDIAAAGLGGSGLSLSTEAPSYQQYWSVGKRAVEEIYIYSGLVKSSVFGLVIAAVAGARGLLASRGAQGVGIAVRETVVGALIAIIILNFIISNLFAILEKSNLVF